MEAEVTAGTFELVFSEKKLVGLDKLKGVGPKTVRVLKSRGILDQRDLLLFMPRKYKRCGHFLMAHEMMRHRVGHVEFYAPIVHVQRPSPGTRQPLRVDVDYEGQIIKLLWFGKLGGSKNFSREMRPGVWMHVTGAVNYDKSIPEMSHPEFSVLGDSAVRMPEDFYTVEPIYPSLEGIKSAMLRKAQLQALSDLLPLLVDIVPQDLLNKHDMPGIGQALYTIHVLDKSQDVEVFIEDLKRAKKRLKYEEFYTLQLKLAKDYAAARETARAPELTDRTRARKVLGNLPFSLTGDQSRSIKEIAANMSSNYPMRRLLQGDVGAGKTVVGLLAAAIAVDNGYQAALMAPTDILAKQHLARAEQFFGDLGIRLGFLGGSLGAVAKREVLAAVKAGEVDLLVGTHSLFQDDVEYANLGLVLIDEQHKFGVEQRQALLGKGTDPHLLAMTATPIPRSLAHAVFGDLDLTIIKEKPPGRQPIKTVLRTIARAPKAYDYICNRIKETGEQAYFVYPMVEASDMVPGRKNVIEAAKELSEGPFADLNVGVLHGRLDAATKESTMASFIAGEINVLCATTVIEVGVDVSNATMMVIESPEVFGLSQLHQLRGRVGRGDVASMCVLLAGQTITEDAEERLVSFQGTDDGFELAEVDLKIRGPGLFLGVRQAGAAEFRFGDLHKDAALLSKARTDARKKVLGAGADAASSVDEF